MKRLFYFCGAAMLMLGAVACSSKISDESRVSDFASRFAQNVKSANRDSITAMYPGVGATDSLAVAFVADSLVVTPVEGKPGEFTVDYGKGVSMTVVMAEDGSMKITSSTGLYAYPEERLETARKYGQWKAGLPDKELAKRMCDTTFTASLVPGFVKEFKGNVKGTNFKEHLNESIMTASYSTSISNSNKVDVAGSDYTISWTGGAWVGMMLGGNVARNGSKPGKDIKAGGSVSYTISQGPKSWITSRTPNISWKLTDQQIFDKYYKPTGSEYEDYLKTKK